MKKIYLFFAATLITVNSMPLPLVVKRLGSKILNNKSIYNNQIIINSTPQALRFNHQIIQGNMLDGLDLRKSLFNKCTFLNVNLDHRDLEEAEFHDSDLRGTSFRGTNLTKASINGCDLTEAKLNEAKMQGANLNWSNLTNANFTESDLNNADLRESILAHTNFSLTNLKKANLEKSDLTSTILCGTDLSSSILKKANLKGLYINTHNFSLKNIALIFWKVFHKVEQKDIKNWLEKIKFKETLFNEADLEETIFENSTILGSDFIEANLINTNFKNAFLVATGFHKANLININLEDSSGICVSINEANLEEVNLKNTILAFLILQKTNLKNVDLRKASLIFTVFQDINIDNCDLRESKLYGIILPPKNCLPLFRCTDQEIFNLYHSDKIDIKAKKILKQILIARGYSNFREEDTSH